MGNHVKNRIKIIGSKSDVASVLKVFATHYPEELNKADDGDIICKKNDNSKGWGYFNKETNVFSRRGYPDVIGMPEGWEMEVNKAFYHFPDFEKIIPMPQSVKETIGDPGTNPKWFEWSKQNWRSPSNSIDCERIDDNTFLFYTMYYCVPNLIKIMSLRFPELHFEYHYADEFIGNYTGAFKFKNGIQSFQLPLDGSKEAYDLAFMLTPELKQHYELIGGCYKVIDKRI